MYIEPELGTFALKSPNFIQQPPQNFPKCFCLAKFCTLNFRCNSLAPDSAMANAVQCTWKGRHLGHRVSTALGQAVWCWLWDPLWCFLHVVRHCMVVCAQSGSTKMI